MRAILLVLIVVCGFFGCAEKFETVEGTGIKGIVYSGSSGCSSNISEEEKRYDLYNGFLYFLDKSDFDNHIELNQAYDADSVSQAIFSHMKGHSFSAWVGYGALDVEVPTGIYYLATRDVMGRSNQHIITIIEGTVVEVDLRFWKCIDS
ncbi:MAG: hypothetical protein ACI85F_000835 [Bacteroidia bacterium]|jgi:hypothetical protein